VRVLHAAELANGQAFASGLQFFVAKVFVFARLAALGRRSVGRSHGAVSGHVCLGVFGTLFCYGKRSYLRNEYEGQECFFHKFPLKMLELNGIAKVPIR
jgi:hypothetical protein